MDGIVYLITNTANGKTYVGSTGRTLDERMRDHWGARNSPQTQLHPLYQDLNTYGLQAFQIEPLLTMKYWGSPELWMVEDAYIAIHDSINNGYNQRYNTFHLEKPDDTGFRQHLEQGYVLTHNKDDYVAARDIIVFMKSLGCDWTDTKIGRELAALALVKDNKKIDGSCVRIWRGLKARA
jgi:hypothetical protein